MQNAFKKIGAAVGGALMLGSTLAGAALAAGDVSKFYTDYAVKDGSADDTMFVIGSGGSSPSGLAMDVVSAIGISAQVGQKALKTAGAGTVTLAVETTTVDGRELKTELTDNLNADLASSTSNLVLRSKEKAATNALSTLGSGTVTIANTDYKWEEKITIAALNTSQVGFAASRTVTSSDGTAGYDAPVLAITGTAGWLQYDMTFETAPTLTHATATTNLVSQASKIRFLGKDYTVLSGSNFANGIKLAESGKEQTLAAGQTIESGNLKIKLVMVQAGSTSTDDSTAILEITPTGGTAISQSVKKGESTTVSGSNIYVKSAGTAYAANQQTSSATLIIGADILTLEDGKYLKWGGKETRWQVDLTGADTGLTGIILKLSDAYTGSSALPVGGSISMPGDLVKLTFNGFDAALSTTDLTLQADNYDLDGDGTQALAVRATLPTKSFKIGTSYYDEVYITGAAQTATTGSSANGFNGIGKIGYKNTTNLWEHTTLQGAAGIQIDLGDKQYILNSTLGHTARLIEILEPATKYASTTRGKFTVHLDNSTTNARFRNNSGNGAFLMHDFTVSSATTSLSDISFASGVAQRDSSNLIKSLANYVTPWGTVVKEASESKIVLQLTPAQRFTRATLGSTLVAEETAIAAVGEEVTIGGAKINVKDAGAAGAAASGVPLPIAKVDADVSATDKSSKNLVLIGGPVVNSLTAELATKLKDMSAEISNTLPGEKQGRVAVVEDAFATGKVAVVVAGSDRYGTQAAAQVLQLLDTFTASVAGKAVATVKYTAANSAPTVV